MASALCVQCGAEFGWVARRGMRLVNITSPCCGAAGAGFRYDRRRSFFVTVERYGSIDPPERWGWRASWQAVYLLANGRIQLDNRVIYVPGELLADARYFAYVGSDPYLAGYRLRMRERDWRDLLGTERAGDLAPTDEWPRRLPTLMTEGSAGGE